MNTGIFLLGLAGIGSRAGPQAPSAPGRDRRRGLFWHLLQTYGLGRRRPRDQAGIGIQRLLAFVIGLLAFLYLAAVVVVVCAELNAPAPAAFTRGPGVHSLHRQRPPHRRRYPLLLHPGPRDAHQDV